MASLLIGQVAGHAGVPAATIRYYESIGLLKPPARSAAGYRRYSQGTVEELAFIKKAQALGFSLDEIGEVLAISRAGRTPCERVLAIAHRHLAAVDERIRQLQRFRAQLAAALAKWDGKTTPTCRGLCQFIALGDAESCVEPTHVHSRRRASKASP